jgi:hypothetical protein
MVAAWYRRRGLPDRAALDSSLEQPSQRAPCKALALALSVRQLDHKLASKFARNGLSNQFGDLPRRIMPKLSSALFAHDPVVERVVWDYMDCDVHDATFPGIIFLLVLNCADAPHRKGADKLRSRATF